VGLPPELALDYRCARTGDATTAWNLSIPFTTGLPHRPTSSDGHTSIFLSSNPIERRYRRFRFRCRSYRLSSPKDASPNRAPPAII
jgi:hypothetical protein